MPEVSVPAYTVGIDQVSDETALPSGAVRDALNVDFDREGRARRRPGARLVQATPTHSLWRGNGSAYCVQGDQLCQVTASGAIPFYTLPHAAPLSYAALNDRVIAANTGWIGEILPDQTVRALGVEDGALSGATAESAGGLPAGRYGVAVACLRGEEEGALSRPRFVDVPEGGGIRVTLPTPSDAATTGIRLYRTTANGEVLYRGDDMAAGLLSVLVGNTPIGRAADALHLRRMLPGSIVRAWRGRLLVARGRTLYFSESLRYGLYSPRTGYVAEAKPIAMVAPVDGGVYVGTSEGVTFYRGTSPAEWSRTRLGAAAPICGTQVEIDTSLLHPEQETGASSRAALWLSPAGWVVGLPDGSLRQPQSHRLSLHAQRGCSVIFGRQAIAVVQ